MLIALLCACSPTLDWRQVRPVGLDLEAMFPCRPATMSREVTLAQRRVEMAMHACAAGGSTYAVGAAALEDVRDVEAALTSLREAAAHNLSVSAAEARAIQVPGMTPHEACARLTLTGTRPDGTAVVEHLAVFARGARVYQAMVVGDRPDVDAVSTFFDGLKVGL
ncbi:MAG TPA: hypothetical protein VEX14_10090 [Burkholderiaceae bacterium]|nr:hypothetical protein [Burkholderiaceae bacterium]